ncbi:MAG: SDR family NAD(P)-dependent oxidoreductase [Cyclobacteriaceae bacterium]
MDHFSGKNILIVGGTSGIGAEIVKMLSDTEANLILASRNEPADELASRVKHIRLDVKDMDGELSDLPSELHGLVYCPGTINLKPFQGLKTTDLEQDFQLNVIGAVKVIQAALKNLRAAKGSSIVLFSTVAVQLGLNYHASIAAAKGALEGLGRSLAAEFASKKIRVNLVAPSLTDTPLAKNLLSTEDKKEASDKRHPIGRYGKPEDIANMVVFLLSSQSDWMTGQVLHVDGGLSTLNPL